MKNTTPTANLQRLQAKRLEIREITTQLQPKGEEGGGRECDIKCACAKYSETSIFERKVFFTSLTFYFKSIHFIGCQMFFAGESVDQRLVFFPSDLVLEQTVEVPANQRCTFYHRNRFNVQYLDCTGSWRSIESPNVLDTIELTPGWSSSQLKIRVSFYHCLSGQGYWWASGSEDVDCQLRNYAFLTKKFLIG